MEIKRFIFNPFSENTYLIWDDTLECVIIDAGNHTPAADRTLDEFIGKHGLKPVLAANTHGHIDHLLGVLHVVERWSVEWALPASDRFLVDGAAGQAEMFGLAMRGVPVPTRDLADGDSVRFGNSELRVIATPGHTPGHVCFFAAGLGAADGDEQAGNGKRTDGPAGGLLFTGDTLFRDSIGRTDLPGGDYSWIMRSIIDRLLPLGHAVAIFPGHGADSTLGHEALYNPFITEVLNQELGVSN